MQSVGPVQRGTPLQASVLIVTEDAAFADTLQRALQPSCALVDTAQDVAQADALRARCLFDLIVLDISQRDRTGIDWLAQTRSSGRRGTAVVVSDHTDARLVLDAMHAGAQDFVEKSFGTQALVDAVIRILPPSYKTAPPAPANVDEHIEALVGRSPAIQDLRQKIIRLAPRTSLILIQGETGTGKELVAQTLHELSDRQGEFVPVNCSALSPEIIESELFGHVRGAFTSAVNSREGLFHYARKGTLFLDEVSEMPWEMQAKLLRALEERSVRPVGADREVDIDTRVVCASNRDLSECVAAGKFRHDLYYRINVIALYIPPLRERPEDLLELAPYLSNAIADEMGIEPLSFTEDELKKLQSHAWPGNVRELRNVIERALLLGQPPSECCQVADAVSTVTWPAHLTLAEVEKRHILNMLNEAGGNKSEAARRLGISRKTLERKVKAWNGERDAQVSR
jgi:two-component system NtrC family response regulator